MNTLKLVRAALWAAILLVGGLAAAILLLPQEQRPQQATIGGPFVLTSHTGERFDSRSLAGKPYLLFFGFTHCPDICPTTLFDLSETLKTLGPAGQDLQVLFVSVDPERDTPELMRDYLSSFDPRIRGLTGTQEEIAAVLRSHRALARKVDTPSGYTMDHTAAVYLFDRKGQFVSTFDHSEAPEAQKAKLGRLLAG